ncbi:MAG: hypothetical protein B7C24_01895 [Bacteroidetes bacterium 4572_77]|nr:MAG: hypothetical protein B7C24_01895 [Bacteroidetes bacterium 4572_77]
MLNIWNIILIMSLIVFTNIPFGYWRFKVKNLSFQWFAAVHIPIPFIFLFRIYLKVDHSWVNTPLMVLSFLTGQYMGIQVHKLLKKRINTSSWIFVDLWKVFFSKFTPKSK